MIARFLTLRRSLLVLGTVLAGLAFPAGAMAKLYTLNTGSVKKNDGFKLSLHAFNTNQGYGAPNQTTFTATLKRTTGHATQTASYAFSGRKVNLTGKGTLGSGRIKGTLPKGRGSINMTFHGTGSVSKASVPKGCTGVAGKKRSGTLSGSLNLKADKLGTVSLKAVRATLSTAQYTCSPGVKGYLLEATRGQYYVTATKPTSTGSAKEAIQVTKNGSGYGFTYIYAAAKAPTSDYTVGSALKRATVKGAGGIGGEATYNGTGSSSQTYGKLTGTLWVRMAAIGVVRPFATANHHTIKRADQRHA